MAKELVVSVSEADLEKYGEHELVAKLAKNFEKTYDLLWEILINLYLVWIEPSAVKEVTTQSLINVNEVYEFEISLVGVRETGVAVTSPGAAVLLMFDSFLFLFHTVLQRLAMFSNMPG